MKAESPSVKPPFKTSDSRWLGMVATTAIFTLIGLIVGGCAAVLMGWNEHQFGAQVSSYRFQWFTALVAPGAAVASRLAFEDRQLGAISIQTVCVIAISNGICYLLASMTIRMLWLALKGRR